MAALLPEHRLWRPPADVAFPRAPWARLARNARAEAHALEAQGRLDLVEAWRQQTDWRGRHHRMSVRSRGSEYLMGRAHAEDRVRSNYAHGGERLIRMLGVVRFLHNGGERAA